MWQAMSNPFRQLTKKEQRPKDDGTTEPYVAEYPSPANAPPDFGLAPLTEFDPNVLKSGNRDVDGFVLSLALAYNDLKSIGWTHYQVDRHRPSQMRADPVAGQISGMTVWVMRMSMAIFHELLKLVRKADQEGWLKSPEFQAALDLLDPDARGLWDAFVGVAVDKDGDSVVGDAAKLRKYLMLVRNNVSYHYDQPTALQKAYDAYFFERPRDEFNEAAYASLGKTLEATRFYFADAAASQYYDSADKRESFQIVDPLRPLVNGALRTVVRAYLESRHRALKA